MAAGLGPMLLRARSDWRARWPTWLVVTVLLGALGGGLIAAGAGTRRTATAYDRLREASSAPDLVLGTGQRCETDQATCAQLGRATLLELAGADGVDGLTIVELHQGLFAIEGGAVLQRECDTGPSSGEMTLVSATELSRGAPVHSPVVIEGRAPDPTAANEVLIGIATRGDGVRVGDTIHAELGEFCSDGVAPARVPVDLEVVGVAADVIGVRPEFGQSVRPIYSTPAFRSWAEEHGVVGAPIAMVAVAEGTPLDAFFSADIPEQGAFPLAELEAAVRRSVRPDVLVLVLITALGTALALLVVAPALVRVERDLVREAPSLRAIGCTHRDLATLGLVHGLSIALPAAVLAILVAALLSALTPVGDAAAFEPSPGFALDAAVVVPGVLALVLATLVLCVVTAAVRPRTVRMREGLTLGARVAAALRMRPTGRLGVRFGFDAVANRSATGLGRVVTQALAIAAVVGALTFSAGLAKLDETPTLRGWNWTHAVFGAERAEDLVAELRNTPGVDRASAGTFFVPGPGGVRIGEDAIPSFLMSLEAGTDSVQFTVIDGRSPVGDEELLVHPKLLDRLGLRLGDQTTVRAIDDYGGRTADVTIVGTGVLPTDADQVPTGTGMTYDGLVRLIDPEGTQLRPDFVVFDLDASVDAGALEAHLVEAGLVPEGELVGPDVDAGATPLLDTAGVDAVPMVLAVLAAVLAATVLAHLLVARRRAWETDLALHRTVGMTRRQTRRAVALGATLVALPAAAAGILLGVALGRIAWVAYAENLGVKPEPAVPYVEFVGLTVAALVVAVLASTVTGWLVDRRSLGEVLRAE